MTSSSQEKRRQEKDRGEHLRSQNFNASLTVDPEGKVVAHYRKTFLYYTDASWSLPSPTGFTTVALQMLGPRPLEFTGPSDTDRSTIPSSRGTSDHTYLKVQGLTKEMLRTSFGICMDLNPQYFTAPWRKYELATHTLETKASMLVVSTAWMTRLPSIFDNTDESTPLHTPIQPSSKSPTHQGAALCCALDSSNIPDHDSFSYWLERLSPLVTAERDVLVVVANRIGVESGIVRGCNLEAIKATTEVRPQSAPEEDLGDSFGKDSQQQHKEDIEVGHAGAEPIAEFTKLVDEDEEGGIVSRSAHYAGTSVVMTLGKGKVRLWGIMGRGVEGVLVADTDAKEKAVWVVGNKEAEEDSMQT